MMLLAWLTPLTMAQILEVREPRRGFTAEYGKEKVIVTGSGLAMSFEAAPCNSLVFKHLHDHLPRLKQLGLMIVGERPNHLTYKIDGRTYNEPRSSDRGQYLSALPLEYRRLKQEEALACAKPETKR